MTKLYLKLLLSLTILTAGATIPIQDENAHSSLKPVIAAPSNPFQTEEWDKYRLDNPEKSSLSFFTQRLEAKAITDESLPLMYECGLKIFAKEDVIKHWGGSRTDTAENRINWKNFLNRNLNRGKANLLNWRGIFLKDSESEFLGFVGAHRYPDNNTIYTGAVEVVYAFDSDHWGKGYACEAVKGYMDHEISRLENYNYILATTDPLNEPSIKLIQKMGFHSWNLDLTDSTIPDHLKTSKPRIYWRKDK